MKRELIQRAFAYIQGHKVNMGIAHEFDITDFHAGAIDPSANDYCVKRAWSWCRINRR